MFLQPKTESWTISEFMNRKEETTLEKIGKHFENHGMIYKAAGVTVFILIAGGGFDYAFADGYTNDFVDREAKKIYDDLVDIGKWVIIVKGGWEVISATLKSDFDSAKKNFIGYVIAYLFLLGLPAIMDRIDRVFQGWA